MSERIHRAEAAGLTWPLAPDLDDLALERLLYPGAQGRSHTDRAEPDWAALDAELRRKGVTLELLWIEYKREHPDRYQYSWFCERYRRWQQRVDPVLRQPYRAGENLFVDYAGRTVSILDPRTGEVREAILFVFVCAPGVEGTHPVDSTAQHCQFRSSPQFSIGWSVSR